MLITLYLDTNSGLRGSNKENTLLKQLFISKTRPLINSHCYFKREPRDNI